VTLLTAAALACASGAAAAEMNERLAPLAPLLGKTWRGVVSQSVEDGAIASHEVVKGSAGGIAEVKATSRLLPDGRLHVKSRHLRNRMK
jgi:ABC-type sugar transport system substrate-binding protein